MVKRVVSSTLAAILAALVLATTSTGGAAQQQGADVTMLPNCKDPGIQPPTAANSHASTPEDYPPLSAALGEQGRVVLEMTVKEDGSVSDIKVLRTSGFPRLDEAAATELVPRWKYTPAMKNGKPVECRWEAVVNWNVQGRSTAFQPDFPVTVIQMGPDYYADDMRSRHEEGSAVVFGLLQEDGKILLANVVKSSGYADIDAASLKFVQSGWQFKAAEMAGRPIKTVVAIALVWSLTPQSDAGATTSPIPAPPTGSPPTAPTIPQ